MSYSTKQSYNVRFSSNIVMKLKKFAYENMDENKKTFKDLWNNWVDDNENMLHKEYKNITKKGYKKTYDDMLQKMFKSVKYHYVKDMKSKKDSDEYNDIDDDSDSSSKIFKRRKEKKPRSTYIHISKEFTYDVIEHISEISDEITKPGKCFVDFAENYSDSLRNEANRIKEEYNLSMDEIGDRIIKAYKTRLIKYRKSN